MPIGELAEMLPAMGVVLPRGTSLRGGTAGIAASMEGPVDQPSIDGSLSLNNTTLAGFNLSSKMSGIERMAGIKGGPDTEIQVLSGRVKVAPEGIVADEIKLVLPAVGDLSGGGTVSHGNALNFKMQAAVHTSGMAAILNNQPVPFTVEGTPEEPIFHPDVKAVVKGMENGVGKAAGGLVKGLLGGKKTK
jgi:AsmA protein